MSVVYAGDFRNGVTFEMDGSVFKVIEFLHVKPGKGPAFVRTKIKNVMTGSTIDKTFNPNEKFEIAEIERREMQYLYNDGEFYYLMDNETFEQLPATKSDLEGAIDFLKENMNVTVVKQKGKVIDVEPPIFVELEVTYTEPGFSGNTTTTSGKPATMENGLEIEVPLFVKIGDVIKIDTRTKKYSERVKQTKNTSKYTSVFLLKVKIIQNFNIIIINV